MAGSRKSRTSCGTFLWLGVRRFATPWTAALQASLSFTISQSFLKLMSVESMMPSNHLILCRPLLLLPSIFLSIRVFSSIWDRLLINSKPNSRKNSTLQTVRIERSPLLDQVRTFLPQMAQANEKLRKEMAAAPPGHFNIENTDETLGQVIQMDVALFEMNQSHSKEEDSSEENSQDSSEESSESEDEDDSTSSEGEVTIDNIKLPHSEDGKGKIEVLDSPASENKEKQGNK